MKSLFFQFHSSGDKPNITMENEFQSTRVTLRWVGTPLCDQYRDVPLDRAVYFRPCPKQGIQFCARLF